MLPGVNTNPWRIRVELSTNPRLPDTPNTVRELTGISHRSGAVNPSTAKSRATSMVFGYLRHLRVVASAVVEFSPQPTGQHGIERQVADNVLGPDLCVNSGKKGPVRSERCVLFSPRNRARCV